MNWITNCIKRTCFLCLWLFIGSHKIAISNLGHGLFTYLGGELVLLPWFDFIGRYFYTVFYLEIFNNLKISERERMIDGLISPGEL
jgi:TM2 domain-containing membrane protein YozV